MFIRLATQADLDAMTWVLAGAAPLDPVYGSRFPDQHLYPGEFAALCRRKCAEYLETSTVVVCEMPVGPKRGDTRIVAFSVWDMPEFKRPAPARAGKLEPTPQLPLPPTTIGARTRQAAVRSALARNRAALFDARYRPLGGHVFLELLLCHPAHRRRGAGAALARWGATEARRRGLHTTVFVSTSPAPAAAAAAAAALSLYDGLGFQEVGRFRVQLGDGDGGGSGEVEITALVLPPGDGHGLGHGMSEAEVNPAHGLVVSGSGSGPGRLLCGRRVGECGGGVYPRAACA